MERRRGRGLGYIARKHAEYAHNALNAYREEMKRARKLAQDGDCTRALEAVVEAGWKRGVADSNAGAGRAGGYVEGTRIPGEFWEGGPGIAARDAGWVIQVCGRHKIAPLRSEFGRRGRG